MQREGFGYTFESQWKYITAISEKKLMPTSVDVRFTK